MKKVIKSISVLVLSLALTVSGLNFVQTAKADEISDWKANAIKTPTEGSLIGAGYIEVEFDNSLSGYFYEVFLDNKPVYWDGNSIVNLDIDGETIAGKTRREYPSGGSGSTTTSEVYTTDVAKHEITIKATKGSETIISNPRTIYVSKKGLAMGDNMGTKVSLKKLNCSWYYNWGTKAFNNSVDNNVPHIPMMWGGYEDSIKDIQNLNTNSNYILGFNEPDIESQANMGFWDGVDIWNQYIKPLNLRKVSPAPAAPGGNSNWLNDFINGNTICQLPDGTWDYYSYYSDNPSIIPVSKEGVDSNSVDAMCLHYYMNWMNADGLIESATRLWNTYHKPVWITEIGLFGVKGTDRDMSYEKTEKRAEIKAFLQDVMERLNNLPFVERFCWFPYDVESANAIDVFDGSGGTAMFEYATGLYTELGKMYSTTGNPSGYSGGTITDSEMFNWENRVRTDINYDQYTDKLTVSWDNGTLSNLGKVDVTIDEVPYVVSNGGQIDTTNLDKGKHAVEFVLYDTSNEVIIKKNRGFEIDRSLVPTTVAPTTVAPTTKSPLNPTVKPSARKPGATVIKVKNVKKKSAKISWKPVSGAKKYKLQWAMNKKFTKKKKTKTVTKIKFTVKKLKKKRTYFFRVAAINDMGTSPWSNVKKLKIKK